MTVDGRLDFALIGATAAVTPLLSLHLITRGRGLGLGDVKLAASIGVVLGWQTSLTVLGLAFILGALVAGAGLIAGILQRRQKLAFAPYLAAAATLAICLKTSWGLS